MQKYSKAIAAIIGGVATLLGVWGINVDWLTPELTTAAGMALTTILVAIAPANK